MDDDYNEIPLEEKIIIFTGDISSKPHIKFKKYFSFLTKVAPIANRLIITFLKIYLNNFIPTKGNHETSGNFSYCTNLNCENGNDVYSFLEEYFADKKDCFYDNYLSFIDQKILALFVKITVIKNKEILYRHFYNHSPIITEPIFSETNNKSGIKNKKELKFYASSYGENDMHNPYYYRHKAYSN